MIFRDQLVPKLGLARDGARGLVSKVTSALFVTAALSSWCKPRRHTPRSSENAPMVPSSREARQHTAGIEQGRRCWVSFSQKGR
jgi:hypothetical protein